MSDIALIWSNEIGGADIAIVNGDLVMDDGLNTANLISLFTDARAREGDGLRDGDDPHGWWGDMFNAPGEETGSRLWLLARSKKTAVTLERGREFSNAALGWMVTDKIASAVTLTVESQPGDVLTIGIEQERPFGPARQRYDYLWNATGASLNGL
jgi:phage gp46-like protein